MATQESTSPIADAQEALHRANYQFNELGAIARSVAALVQKIPDYGKDEEAVSAVFTLAVLVERASSFASQADEASLKA